MLSSDLTALGYPKREIRDLVRAGVLRPVLRGVYVRGDLDDTIGLRCECAARLLPEHCVVSDLSAAWLHGVDCYSVEERCAIPPLDVVSLPGRSRTRRPGVRGGHRDLLPGEITQVHGVRTTTAVRTACDVAALHGRLRAMQVLNAFCRGFQLSPQDYRVLLPRLAGRRGVIQVRELINYAHGQAESAGESWTRISVIDASFPPPTPQIWVYLDDFGWVRLDMGYEHLKIAIEYDGEEFHSSTEDREYDQKRREALVRAGWIVIVVRKDGFSGDGLDVWVRALREAVKSRSPRPVKHKYSRGESLTHPARRRSRD